MIYVNKNKARIIVPRINQSPEYEQNKVVDIIVTNQVTKETRELQLIDESTDKNYYEFDNPLHYDVRGYEGTYDYKIVYGNGSVVLSSGIVVVEPDNVADNTISVKSYEYYPDKIVQYTPNTEYVPQVESIKEIKQNGDYWVKYYDRVIVDVPIPDITEFEQEIENLNNELEEKEAYINTAKGITITSNGVYTPEEGVVGYNEINVEVEGSGGKVVLADGTKFGYSTLTEVPDYYDFSEITDFSSMFYYCKTITTVPQINASNGIDFSYMFYYCNNLTSVPSLDTSKGTDFTYMFSSCSNLTSVGNLDTSNGTDFEYMFAYCSNLISVPSLDMSKGTNFSQMFSSCSNLTSVGNLDTSNGTDFSHMFYNCRKLTEVPALDTSNGTDFSNIFQNCTSLAEVPALDMSKGTDFSYMFASCTKLTNIPQLDTSNGTYFSEMFSNCTSLTTVPPIDTSKGTNFGKMLYNCTSLTTVPQLDLSNGTYFSEMFSGCGKLTEVPALHTSKGTNFTYMFQSCSNLTTIPQLNITNGNSFTYTFRNCTALENISFVGSINYNIDFSSSSLLTYDSIKSILSACAATTRTSVNKTLKFSRTIADPNGELAALVGDCTTKGWTLTGLTLV